jgi:pimeloyl-ACP methyl ester carboxylesterase
MRCVFGLPFLLALACTAGSAQEVANTAWTDPSSHRTQFVTVAEGVRLEVLDWGGSGRNVVLLTGSGNTAHVYDDFAEKLSAFSHVYGITRRGYGLSSHPDSGYEEERLAEDVLQVLDTLKIASPVLVGHSAAGEELTTLGDEHSDRLSGLVYLDAAADPTDWPASSPAYMELFRKLPQGKSGPPPDRTSFRAYREWQIRAGKVPFPESELHQQYAINPDGSMGAYKASTPAIHKAFGDGARPRDYSRIRVPVLALMSWSCTKRLQIPYVCIKHPHFNPDFHPKPNDKSKDAQERDARRAFGDATLAYIVRWNQKLMKAPGGVRLVDIPGADHHVFLSNEDDVLSELRSFLRRLH